MKICRSAHSKDLQFRQRHPGCGELHARFPPGLYVKDQARSRKNQAHGPRASTPCVLGSLIHGSQSVSFLGHPSLKHIFQKAKGNRLNTREDSLLPASSQGFPVDKASFLRPSKGHTVRVLLPRHCLATVVSTEAAFVQAAASGRRGMIMLARRPPFQLKGSRNLLPNREKTHREGLGPSFLIAV